MHLDAALPEGRVLLKPFVEFPALLRDVRGRLDEGHALVLGSLLLLVEPLFFVTDVLFEAVDVL